jgi:hypothetical protein
MHFIDESRLERTSNMVEIVPGAVHRLYQSAIVVLDVVVLQPDGYASTFPTNTHAQSLLVLVDTV